MADNVLIDNGVETDYTVSSDEGVGGHVQRVKLAYSADGSETHVPADGDGLLVNLGTNNDITGTVTANLSATDNAVLDAIAASVAAIDADATTIVGHVDGIEALLGTIDADTSALAGAVSGTEVQVDIVAALPAGTNAIGKLAANSGVDIGDVDVLTLPNVTLAAGTNTNEVVGDAAHDAAVAGNPLLQGFEARSTAPTAVGSGDAVRALATLLGKQVVYPYAIPAETWQYAGPNGGITDTADDAIQAAGGAGVRHYLTDLTVINAHATVGTGVVIKDGSTVIHRGYAAAAGGGYTITFNSPLRGTAATALNVACITTGSATVVSASGFSASE